MLIRGALAIRLFVHQWPSPWGAFSSWGIQLLGSYIYAYNFGEDPVKYGPTGSINGSRVPIRLELTVEPPQDVDDKEWEVQVFVLTNNWMRFENGLAELSFKD